MFDPKVVASLARTHSASLTMLQQVEEDLRGRFTAELHPAIRTLILAVASGYPLLLVGPPGTGKSRLIRDFCILIGALQEDEPSGKSAGSNGGGAASPNYDPDHYFEYLLTPFTEPGELFGFFDVGALQKSGTLKRIEEGTIQKARVVYLDEVFNASSAILNSLLAFLNERKFHDRGQRIDMEWKCLFGATNNTPETPELRAVFDRFILRCWVENVRVTTNGPHDPLRQLLVKGWSETLGGRPQFGKFRGLLAGMDKLQEDIRVHTLNRTLMPSNGSSARYHGELARLIALARNNQMSAMSNRRLIQMSHIMLIHRMYEGVIRKETSSPAGLPLREEELRLVGRYFLDRMDEALQPSFESVRLS